MWAKPPTNLAGNPGKTHLDPGSVKCTSCGKSNSVTADDRKKGKIECVRCGETIKVAR